MSDVRKMRTAAVSKNDEFYTCLDTIKQELQYYTLFFANKVVYCNCDNPSQSAFWEFFHTHFSELHLNKLIATYYDRSQFTYKCEYTGGADTDIYI